MRKSSFRDLQSNEIGVFLEGFQKGVNDTDDYELRPFEVVSRNQYATR